MGPRQWVRDQLGRAWVRIQLDPEMWFWYGVLIVSLTGLAVILGLIISGGHR
jgi:hypothetical protein